MTKRSPFRYFKTSSEFICLAVMHCSRFLLSLRNVEDLLYERGIEIGHETVRNWWNRFGPMFAAEIKFNRVEAMRACRQWQWQWHLDKVYVKIPCKPVSLVCPSACEPTQPKCTYNDELVRLMLTL